MNCPLQGADAELVDEWRVAYNEVSQAEMHWKTVLDEARMAVHEWYATPGRKELVARVAEKLAGCTCVHGDGPWRQFVRCCQPARQAPRSVRNIDLNRLRPEVLECLMDLYDWRTVGHGRAGFVLRSW
jgi:hypothetical protein